MKQLIFVPLLVIFLCGCSIVLAAQTAEVRRIDAYTRTIDVFTKKTKGPQLVFADVSDYTTNEKPIWRKFASEKALEKHRKTTEAYTIAYVWRKGGKLVASNFTLFSPSGDWTKYVYSYFREDGTLAKAAIDYRTFYGDFIILQNLYFDKTGKRIKSTIEYKDLITQKPKKPTQEYLDGNSSLFDEVDYYKTARKLPFAHLLAKSSK